MNIKILILKNIKHLTFDLLSFLNRRRWYYTIYIILQTLLSTYLFTFKLYIPSYV